MKREQKKGKRIYCRIIAVVAALAVATAPVFAGTYGGAAAGADEAVLALPAAAAPFPAEQYFEDQRVIAHGGGSYRGYDTTNSVEAVTQSIQNGYKLIELDMEFSSDGGIVMIHDWDRTADYYFGRPFDEIPTSEEFSQLLVNGKFQTLTMDRLQEILAWADTAGETAGVRIVTDTKGDNLRLLAAIAEQYPELVYRIIPQIYEYGEYEKVRAMGYESIILTVYRMKAADKDELVRFAKEKDLFAVAVAMDFLVKDFWKAIAPEGVRVYCHPIYTADEFQELAAYGVYGVYSGTLLPEDLVYPRDRIYIAVPGENGKQVQLTDFTLCRAAGKDTVAGLTALRVAGLAENEYRIYKMDGRRLNEERLAAAENGRHEMEIEIYRMNERNVGSDTGIRLQYVLWKDASGLRILAPQYAYRLEELNEPSDFEAALDRAGEKSGLSLKLRSVLAGAFIGKAGESRYYSAGQAGRFKVGDEYLDAQTAAGGKTLLPLAETARALGADSVEMRRAHYVYINCNGNRIQTQINSYFASRNYMTKRIGTPVSLYRSKTMASGEFLELATGRPYLEKEGMLVILPSATTLSKQEQELILQAAALLYE